MSYLPIFALSPRCTWCTSRWDRLGACRTTVYLPRAYLILSLATQNHSPKRERSPWYRILWELYRYFSWNIGTVYTCNIASTWVASPLGAQGSILAEFNLTDRWITKLKISPNFPTIRYAYTHTHTHTHTCMHTHTWSGDFWTQSHIPQCRWTWLVFLGCLVL